MQSPPHGITVSLPSRALTQPFETGSLSQHATPVHDARTPARTPKSYATVSPMSRAMTPAGTPCHNSPMAAVQPELPRARSSRAPSRTTVIAPGAGTGINASVYDGLQRDHSDFLVNIVGQSRAPYDCYPPSWSHGGPAPNLESFTMSEAIPWARESDLLIFGSRGGQVVLPTLWRELQGAVPPAVCINGGCAMNLPESAQRSWPEQQIAFVLIGGQDNFRGNMSEEAYIAETKRWVPANNGTTAILYVAEMVHMPQAALLHAILPPMLRTLLAWKAVQQRHGEGRRRVKEEIRHILGALNTGGWSGHLMFTEAEGVWEDIAFSPYIVDRMPMSHFMIPENEYYEGSPIEYSRRDELRDMIRAAALNARPGGGCPAAQPGARFAAAAHAAVQAAHNSKPPPAAAPVGRSGPFLPIPMAGEAVGSPTLMLPLPRAGLSPCSPSLADATPISRALKLGARRHDWSPAGSYTNSPSYCMVAPIY